MSTPRRSTTGSSRRVRILPNVTPIPFTPHRTPSPYINGVRTPVRSAASRMREVQNIVEAAMPLSNSDSDDDDTSSYDDGPLTPTPTPSRRYSVSPGHRGGSIPVISSRKALYDQHWRNLSRRYNEWKHVLGECTRAVHVVADAVPGLIDRVTITGGEMKQIAGLGGGTGHKGRYMGTSAIYAALQLSVLQSGTKAVVLYGVPERILKPDNPVDYYFFAHNVNGNHWILVGFNVTASQFFVCDSLSDTRISVNGHRTIATNSHWYRDIIAPFRQSMVNGGMLTARKATTAVQLKVMRQRDGHSCGPLVIANARGIMNKGRPPVRVDPVEYRIIIFSLFNRFTFGRERRHRLAAEAHLDRAPVALGTYTTTSTSTGQRLVPEGDLRMLVGGVDINVAPRADGRATIAAPVVSDDLPGFEVDSEDDVEEIMMDLD